jgi:hypothetical protein
MGNMLTSTNTPIKANVQKTMGNSLPETRQPECEPDHARNRLPRNYTLKMATYRYTAQCSLVKVYRYSRDANCLQHQGLIALTTEAVITSETPVNFYEAIMRNTGYQ